MGRYTSMRVEVVVKKEYWGLINSITLGDRWSSYAEQYPFLAKFSKHIRAEFIPTGGLVNAPAHWATYTELGVRDFPRNFNRETGAWRFQCSLRNMNGEIEQFLHEVLPHLISEATHLEQRDEEWANSAFYAFREGKVQRIE